MSHAFQQEIPLTPQPRSLTHMASNRVANGAPNRIHREEEALRVEVLEAAIRRLKNVMEWGSPEEWRQAKAFIEQDRARLAAMRAA